jgi:two-component system phosphate regulon sensor histidine kinase PhoR
VNPDLLWAAIGLGAGVLLAVAVGRARSPHASPAPPTAVPPGPYDDDRTHRVLDALPVAAFLVDARGTVRFLNVAAERLFRVLAERSVGQALIAVVPSVVLERQVRAAIAGEESTHDVQIGEGPRLRTFGVTAHPFEGGAIVIAVDRSDLVALQDVRREFVANVSHELRTPLAAMKLMIETLQQSDDDAEARTLFLPQIAHEVERMIRLVEDLLELARSESGALQLERRTFDLTEIATTVVNAFASRSTASGVDLELEAPQAVYVEADRNRLTQVALNLVDNALRHTPAGGTVVVEVAHVAREAILRVRDTGTGIPYNDLPHIFERFYVVDRSRSREHGGMGLGLSIARHLVEANGGSIGAQSVYGSGATFVCRFPAVSPPQGVDIKIP